MRGHVFQVVYFSGSLALAFFGEQRSSVLSIHKKVKKRSMLVEVSGLAVVDEVPETTEIATLYLALERGVVVADVLFNRGEKRLKRLKPAFPFKPF